MGLDMYLYAEKYINQYDYQHEDGQVSRRDNLEFDKVIESAKMIGLPTGEYGGATVTKCVAYWRKANAIHGWIVRNLANGVDNCQRIYMSREDLRKLRDVCVEALKDRDKAIGSTDKPIRYKDDGSNSEQLISEIGAVIMSEFKRNKVKTVATDSDPIPPTDGAFFGSTNKDEYYYETLAETAETMNALLASDLDELYSYYYQASW